MQGDGLGQSDEEKVSACLNTETFRQETDPKKWVALIVQCTGVSATKINKLKVWHQHLAERLKLWLATRQRATGTDVEAVFGFIPGQKLYLNAVWAAHKDQKRNNKEVRIQPMSDGMAVAIPNDKSPDPACQIDERDYVIDALRRSITDDTSQSTLRALSAAKRNELADHVLDQVSYADMTSNDGYYQTAVAVGGSWLETYSGQHPGNDYGRPHAKGGKTSGRNN